MAVQRCDLREAPTVTRMPLPPVGALLAALHVVAIPMRVPFRGVTTREVALLEGPCGWGEFGPFLEYGPAEASRWLASAVESAWVGWPEALRASVPVNATVPAVGPERVADVLARFPGCTTAKVKVAERGQSLDDDLTRVAAVREVMGRSARLRVDANGAWSVDDAVRALGRLSVHDLEYAEQPCATVEELRDLRIALARSLIDVPVAADESIRKAEDPLRVRDLEAADIVVVKVAPLGGVRSALAVVEACGLPAVVSSALDTSVGIAAGVALAAALPSLEHACGLGTVALLAGDVCAAPLVPVDGALTVGRVVVDPARLEQFAAPADRVAWWSERLAVAHGELSRGGDR
jgi:O-succinylbenzoate synthase